MPQSFMPRACRRCWPATSMSCRPIATSTRRVLRQGRARAAGEPRRLSAHSRSGLGRCHPQPASRCADVRSGITCGTGGRAMPGLRLDHLLLSPEAAKRRRCRRRPSVSGKPEGASDHAPAWVVLGDEAASANGIFPSGELERDARRASKRQRGNSRQQDSTRRLLVIDGDSFARIELYHALPKTMLPAQRQARPARSSASRISCCGSIRRSSPAPCWSVGTR